MKWPLWFPYPPSWLKALSLGLFAGMIAVIEEASIVNWSDRLADFTNRPEPVIVAAVITLLLPIPAIAFTHYLIYQTLGRLIPGHQLKAMQEQGFFPVLLSLWEGIMGWLALTLSTILTLSIIAIVPPWREQMLSPVYQPDAVPTGIILIWLGLIAALYHLEALVERYHQVQSVSAKAKQMKPNAADIELNQLRGDMGLTQIKKPPQQP